MDALVAEDLLLLLLDDETGTVDWGVNANIALGGALLVDLASRGAVELHDEGSWWRAAKVEAVGDAPLDDPLLVEGVAIVAERERTPTGLVNRLSQGLKDKLAARLVERGILERRDRKVLFVFNRTTWPAAAMDHEIELRRRLADVVHGRAPVDAHTGALLSLLHAVGQAHHTVDPEELSARELRRRIAEIAEGNWPAKAVNDAVRAATTAAIAAVMAATIAANSGT